MEDYRGILLAAALAAQAAPLEGQRVAAAVEMSTGGPVLDRPARLVIERAQLVDALTHLGESSGVQLVFSPSLIGGGGEPVSCGCRSVTLAKALDRLLAGRQLRYAVVDGYVVIVPRQPDEDRRTGLDSTLR